MNNRGHHLLHVVELNENVEKRNTGENASIPAHSSFSGQNRNILIQD